MKRTRRFEATVEEDEVASAIEVVSHDESSEGILLIQGDDMVYVHDGEHLDKLILALQLYQKAVAK